MHRDIEAERARFVEALSAYQKRTGHDVTVVFDGWRNGMSAAPTRSVSGGLCVMYSARGQKADELIRQILGEDRRHWIVVSSDREVQSHAWAAGSVPVESEAFLRRLEGPSAGRRPEEEDEEDEGHIEQRRKGNPRKPSKKQKAVERALRKL